MLESSGVFGCLCEVSQTYVGERASTPSNVRRSPHEGVESQLKGAADCSAPSWFSAPPGLTLPMGSRPDYWRNELLYRGGNIERHSGAKRALPLRGRDVLVQNVLPTTAQRYDVAVSEFVKFASQRHSRARRARHTRSQRIGSCLHPVSSDLFCVRKPRSGTAGHSHL